MKYDQHLVCGGWNDYELLDSGEDMKLERFGKIILARPETQSLWSKTRPELWKDAQAVFINEKGKGVWRKKEETSEEWEVAWQDARMTLRLTSFKHVGIFPEQEANWKWTEACVNQISHREYRDVARPDTPDHTSGRATSRRVGIVNFFGYTGAASIVAAQAGAKVTHVDASKQSLDWAHENARLSKLPEDTIRWILDDALAFARREVRRGAKYDGIILDPPAFGRGPKGEVWHIERDLPTLLSACKELLAEVPGAFFLLNGYAAGYASRSLAQAVETAFGGLPDSASAESGELHIREASSERVVPSGIYCRFVRK